MASFGCYLPKTGHDHETPLRTNGSALSGWASGAGRGAGVTSGVLAKILWSLSGDAGTEFMIVSSSGHIAPKTAHDHESALQGASLPEG